MATNIRKKQVRFSAIDDLNLLRYVAAKNPFHNKGKWAEIAVMLSRDGFSVDSRRVRERTQLLMDQHRKETRENLKQSGIEEGYSEKHRLLDEIVSLMEEEDKFKENEIEQNKSSSGKEIRKRAMENLTPRKLDEEFVPKKKPTIVGYLKEKAEGEMTIRKEELDIRKEELKLERERFEVEKEERKQKLLQEKEEKTLLFELLKQCIKNSSN